jgi:conjugative element/phage-associated large polyvalent protein/ADP-ribosyltransferase-like protein
MALTDEQVWGAQPKTPLSDADIWGTPKPQGGHYLTELGKGVVRGAAKTLPEAAAGAAHTASDVSTYLGGPQYDFGMAKGAETLGGYAQKLAPPSPGWEGSRTAQIGEALGNVGVYGAEMMAGPAGWGAAAATAAGQGAEAGYQMAQQQHATPGQTVGAETGMGAVNALLLAIPGAGPMLERLPMAAKTGILGYAARTMYAGGTGATIGAAQSALNDAVEKYTVNPQKVIGEGIANQGLIMGAASALYHGTVGEATRPGPPPPKPPWQTPGVPEARAWQKPQVPEQESRMLNAPREWNIPSLGGRLSGEQFDAWIGQNAPNDPRMRDMYNAAQAGTVDPYRARQFISDVLNKEEKQTFGQPERLVTGHHPLNPRADINTLQPGATREGARTRAALPTEIRMPDDMPLSGRVDPEQMERWTKAGYSPQDIETVTKNIAPFVQRRLQELGFDEGQIAGMSLNEGRDVLHSAGHLTQPEEEGFPGTRAHPGPSPHEAYVTQPVPGPDGMAASGRGAPAEPQVAPAPQGVAPPPESGFPRVGGPAAAPAEPMRPPNAAGTRESILAHPQVRMAADEATTGLQQELKRYGIDERVGLKVVDHLLDPNGDEVSAGWWNNVINVSRDGGANTLQDMLRVMGHEVIGHAYRDFGLYTPQEWNIISKWADKTGRKQYNIDQTYGKDAAASDKKGATGPELLRQEAWARHAEAVLSGVAKEPNGRIMKLIAKLKGFFEGLGNWVRGNGFNTLADVMHRATTGEVGTRPNEALNVPPYVAEGGTEPRFARDEELERRRREEAAQQYAHDPAGLARAEQFPGTRQGMVGETHVGQMAKPLPQAVRPMAELLKAAEEVKEVQKKLTPPEGGYTYREVIGGAFARKQTPEQQAIMRRTQEDRDKVVASPQFKNWFGESAVKDRNGKPTVVYHGSGSAFEAFDPKERGVKTLHPAALLGDYFTSDPRIAHLFLPDSIPELTAKGATRGPKDPYGEGANIVPAYLSIKKPYKIDPADFAQLLDNEDVHQVQALHEELIKGGYDGIHIPSKSEYGNIYVPEELHGADTWVALHPEQVKSAIGNRGTFDPNDIRMTYARRHQKIEMERDAAYAPATRARLAAVVGPVDTRPWSQRIAAGFNRSVFSKIYQRTVDKYDPVRRMENVRKAQGAYAGQLHPKTGEVMAGVSAYKAMIFADRKNSFASQIFANKGVPVAVRDAQGNITHTKIMKPQNVPGMRDFLDILKPNNLFREFQFVNAVERGQRLLAEGRERVIQPGDVAIAQQLRAAHPEIAQATPLFRRYNDALLDYATDMGLVEPAKAAEWKQHGDYISFYRQLSDDDVGGPGSVGGFTGQDPIKKLKGGTEHLGDFLENTTRHTQALLGAGLKNLAAQRTMELAQALGTAQRLQVRLPHMDNVVEVKNQGRSEYYQVNDPALYEALHAMDGNPLGALEKFFRYPSQVLRVAVTRNPAFGFFRHPFRESVSNAIVSPNNMVPLLDTMRGSMDIIRKSPQAEQMKALGVSGGFDYGSGSAESSAHALRAQMLPLGKNMTFAENLNAALHKVWHKWESAYEFSDLGTRAAVFRKEMAAHGDEAEAAYQSLAQAVNFNRRGSSSVMRALTGMVPFLNARVQGLDMLGRAMVTRPSQTFAKMGILAGLTGAYYSWVKDDPLYKQAPDYVKDGYFIIPTGDGHAVFAPIPFEAGVLAKNIPERIMRAFTGDDLPVDTWKALQRAMWATLKLEPEPQSVLPAVEAATNWSFFQGRPIVPRSLEGLPPQYQYTDRTSETAKALGSLPIYPDIQKGGFGEAAPVKVDHILNGYFGALGGYLLSLIDAGVSAGKGDGPPKPASKLTDMPILGQILKDQHNIGSEDVDRVYELKQEADSLYSAVKKLRTEGNTEGAKKLQTENRNVIVLRPRLEAMAKGLSTVRKQQQQIMASHTMSPEEKETRLDQLRRRQLSIASRIEEVRRQALRP